MQILCSLHFKRFNRQLTVKVIIKSMKVRDDPEIARENYKNNYTVLLPLTNPWPQSTGCHHQAPGCPNSRISPL